MNQNRNVLWIALIGLVLVLVIAYLFSRPDGATSQPAPANSLPPTEAPLAPATPVLPDVPPSGADLGTQPPAPGTTPGETAIQAPPGGTAPATPAPPEIPAPSGPTPSQPGIPSAPQ
jgi:hypothetical protein